MPTAVQIGRLMPAPEELIEGRGLFEYSQPGVDFQRRGGISARMVLVLLSRLADTQSVVLELLQQHNLFPFPLIFVEELKNLPIHDTVNI